MKSNSAFEFGAECLGAVGITASWRRPLKTTTSLGRYAPMVVIQQCSSVDENAFSPAADVTILGKDGLLALREVIDEALKYDNAGT